MVTCMEVIRRFSQVVLIIVNIFVALLGLAVMIIGIWAKVDERQYFQITDGSHNFTQVSVLLIVIGLFVMIVGAVGCVGGIFATTVFGRITLGLYAVVLSLLVICEIAGGIAAGVKRGSLEDVFRDSANSTFQNAFNDEDGRDNSETDSWVAFQSGFQCCGVVGYQDYVQKYPNGTTVPPSCCRKNVTSELCEESRTDTIGDNLYNIYTRGCVDAVVNGISSNLGAIAGGAIVLGLIQILGIVLACFVAIYKQKENKYEVV